VGQQSVAYHSFYTQTHQGFSKSFTVIGHQAILLFTDVTCNGDFWDAKASLVST